MGCCGAWRLPRWHSGKESACQGKGHGVDPGSGRSPRVGNGNPLQYSYWENLHGHRSLAGYIPGGCKAWQGVRSSSWTSLVAQCIGICLPMQEARIRSLVWEDSTCHWTTKPVYRNYRVYALQPTSHNFWACAPQLLKPTWLEPVFCNKANHCNEKPARPTKNTPHSPQLEKVHTNAMKTQHSQKKFLNN